MFCPMCGKEIHAGSAFCPNCGAKIRPLQQPQGSQQPQPQPSGAPQAQQQPSGAPQPQTSQSSSPSGAPKKKKTGGMLLGIVIAVVVSLSVAGAGGYLVFSRWSGGNEKTGGREAQQVPSATDAPDTQDSSREPDQPGNGSSQPDNGGASDTEKTDAEQITSAAESEDAQAEAAGSEENGAEAAGSEENGAEAAESGETGAEAVGSTETGSAVESNGAVTEETVSVGYGEALGSVPETTAAALGMKEPSVSDYQTICAALRTLPATYVGYADIMEKMLRPLTDSDILNNNMALRMSDRPQDKPDNFDWKILYHFLGSLDSYGVRNSSSRSGEYVNRSDLDGFLTDYYGGHALTWNLPKDNFAADYSGFTYADEDRIEMHLADGDPWVFGENPQFRENTDYYLVSMPCYYGDNGGADHVYTYDLDALFEKNPSSRFGVTLRYVETSYNGSSALTASSYYIVNCDEWVTLRSAASTKASSILHIPLYSSVAYLGDAGNEFARISYNGVEGYVLKQYVSMYSPFSYIGGYPYRVVNARESITLRTDPSTSGAEILQIPVGSAVTVYKFTNSEFYLVEYNGMMGYAMASYLAAR